MKSALPSVEARPRAREPSVTALVPVWRAEAFIAETLSSLAAQTYPNLRILISDDASPDDSAALCQSFAAGHSNTRVIRQSHNLGWVGNTNALLREASGDYLFFGAHDDLLEPTYVERLVEALEQNPAATVAFSDMETHNLDGSRELQIYDALEGAHTARARAERLLRREGPWWTPYRGLFRSLAAREVGGLRKHLAGEFACDWPWLLRLALLGPFVRVPEVLVIKRSMSQSVSRSWQYHPWQRLAAMLACQHELRFADLSLRDQLHLHRVALAEVCSRAPNVLGRLVC